MNRLWVSESRWSVNMPVNIRVHDGRILDHNVWLRTAWSLTFTLFTCACLGLGGTLSRGHWISALLLGLILEPKWLLFLKVGATLLTAFNKTTWLRGGVQHS